MSRVDHRHEKTVANPKRPADKKNIYSVTDDKATTSSGLGMSQGRYVHKRNASDPIPPKLFSQHMLDRLHLIKTKQVKSPQGGAAYYGHR